MADKKPVADGSYKRTKLGEIRRLSTRNDTYQHGEDRERSRAAGEASRAGQRPKPAMPRMPWDGDGK
jgi:hypothetical protein